VIACNAVLARGATAKGLHELLPGKGPILVQQQQQAAAAGTARAAETQAAAAGGAAAAATPAAAEDPLYKSHADLVEVLIATVLLDSWEALRLNDAASSSSSSGLQHMQQAWNVAGSVATALLAGG